MTRLKYYVSEDALQSSEFGTQELSLIFQSRLKAPIDGRTVVSKYEDLYSLKGVAYSGLLSAVVDDGDKNGIYVCTEKPDKDIIWNKLVTSGSTFTSRGTINYVEDSFVFSDLSINAASDVNPNDYFTAAANFTLKSLNSEIGDLAILKGDLLLCTSNTGGVLVFTTFGKGGSTLTVQTTEDGSVINNSNIVVYNDDTNTFYITDVLWQDLNISLAPDTFVYSSAGDDTYIPNYTNGKVTAAIAGHKHGLPLKLKNAHTILQKTLVSNPKVVSTKLFDGSDDVDFITIDAPLIILGLGISKESELANATLPTAIDTIKQWSSGALRKYVFCTDTQFATGNLIFSNNIKANDDLVIITGADESAYKMSLSEFKAFNYIYFYNSGSITKIDIIEKQGNYLFGKYGDYLISFRYIEDTSSLEGLLLLAASPRTFSIDEELINIDKVTIGDREILVKPFDDPIIPEVPTDPIPETPGENEGEETEGGETSETITLEHPDGDLVIDITNLHKVELSNCVELIIVKLDSNIDTTNAATAQNKTSAELAYDLWGINCPTSINFTNSFKVSNTIYKLEQSISFIGDRADNNPLITYIEYLS